MCILKYSIQKIYKASNHVEKNINKAPFSIDLKQILITERVDFISKYKRQ